MEIVIIVAADETGTIGDRGKIPWHIPADLKRFKAMTMGHPIIMGRKTWESIGRPLPGRDSIVVTRQSYRAEGAIVAHSLEQALEVAEEIERDREDDPTRAPQAFVIGGGEIYREALPVAHRIELTRVHASVPGDTRFAALGEAWRVISNEPHPEGAPPYSFLTLLRTAGG